MKRFFKLIVFAIYFFANFTGFAEAQTSRNPCYTTNGSNCIGVGTSTPMPVTGNSGGFDIEVSNTPTVQNAAYSSGNAIGGLQTISFFRSASQPSGILNNIAVWSKGGSTTAITLYIFTANPSASTCTDRVAFSLNSADVAKLAATIAPVLTPAVVGSGTAVTSASQQSPIAIKNTEGALNIYVCAVVGGSVTPASTTDLVFKFAGIQD